MIIARSFVKYVCGFLTVQVNGIHKERFLNLCHRRNIHVWNVSYKDDGFIYDISVSDFRKIKIPFRKTHVKIKILQRHGLPFFLYKKRKHKIFAVSLVLFFVILYIMSCYIWDITLDGGYTYTEEEIIRFLKENQVYHGMFKKKIQCDEIERLIRNEYFDITWVSAELDGTRLIIHIKENFDDLKKEQAESPRDLTANKDAVITSIITRAGTPQVVQGTEVKEGDILVSGIVSVLDDNKEVMSTHQVCADADVYGQVIYSYEKQFSLVQEEKVYTGKESKSKFLQLFSGRLHSMRSPGYESYDTVKSEHQLHIFDNFYLPIYWGTESRKEYVLSRKTYTEEEAKAVAKQELENFFAKMDEKGIQIIENNVKIDVGNGVCSAKGNIVAIEPIGVGSPIHLEGTNS